MTTAKPKDLPFRLEALKRQLAEQLRQVDETRALIHQLEAELAALNQPAPPPSPPGGPSTPAEKVALFRSLFRGREDVYPRLWISRKKNRKGYSPVCVHDGHPALCDKFRAPCGNCPHRRFAPLDDQAILDHLQGRHVIGVYPLLPDETCWFLAVDFDGEGWRKDARAVWETCRVYDRLFPNQDTMPQGGFGNLIALPLQREARQAGHTLFLDDQLEPDPDPWAHLASLRRMNPCEVEALVEAATRKGRVLGVRFEPLDDGLDATPWERPPSGKPRKLRIEGPIPSTVDAVLSQQIFVEKTGLPPALLAEIKRLAAFQNPEFYQKQAMRFSTHGIPRIICAAVEHPAHLALPWGCREELAELLAEHGSRLVIDDQRCEGEPADLVFQGRLTETQEAAVEALQAHELGIFVAPPGTGKTVLGAYMAALRCTSTLVLVHRKPLLDQWRARLQVFLGLESHDIGQIGGGKRKATGRIDVAMIQSLAGRDGVSDLVANYGHVIVDECHHAPAVSFERVMREVRAKHVLGLTATPYRRDGLQRLLHFQCGPVRFQVAAKSKAAGPAFASRVLVRDTRFAGQGSLQDLYAGLVQDPHRNALIIQDVRQALAEGRSPIVLTERREHLELLAEALKDAAPHVVVLHGGLSAKIRRQALSRLAEVPADEARLILATGRYIGEGFDDARLDTLFLVMPIAWKGTLIQYAGRLHRLHPGKDALRIYDYVDGSLPVFRKMFEKRLKGYRAMGYALDESSALGIPLPLDPEAP